MGAFWSRIRPSLILHTWFCLSWVLTSSGCTCLFIVYAFFPWESSCYGSCLVSHDVAIYCMLDLVDPYGRYYELPFRSRCRILYIILFLLPFLLGDFFIVGRFCSNDVAQQYHITALCLRCHIILHLVLFLELLSLVLWNKSHPSFLVGKCMCHNPKIS